MTDFIEIEVVNWELYNPRTDRKKHSWFRLENSIATESKFFGLSAAQKFVAICLFAEVSKHSGSATQINVAWLADQLKIDPSEIVEAVRHLVKSGVLRLPNGESWLPAVTDRHTTYERTNDTYVTNETNVATKTKKVPSEPTKANAFVRMYCDAFKTRWGDNPQILGKDAGIAKRLAKDLSEDRFAYLLDAYFQMPDAWLVKTKHPLGAFETKLNEIVIFAEQGNFTTTQQARQADNMASNHLLMEKLKREGK